MCVFRGNLVNYLEIYKFYPWETLRLFRRIRKNDVPFLKACVFFAEFAEINMFPRKQILPLGNVRLFRIIHKNDAPFLKTCVFFAEITKMTAPF